MTPLLTIKQTATLLNVSDRTIRRWIENNKIVFVKLPGGDLRIREENLKGWIEKRTVK